MAIPHQAAAAGQRVTTSGAMLYEGGVDYFRSQFCHPLLHADFVPTTDAPFRVTAKLGIVEDHRSLRLYCTPGILRRRSGLGSPAAAHSLVIATGNSCALLIKDQTVRLKPGAAVVIDGGCDFDLVLERDSGRSCLLDWLHIAQGASAVFPGLETFAVISSEAITTYIRFHNELMTSDQGTELTSIPEVPSFNHLVEIIRAYLLGMAPPRPHDKDRLLHERIKRHITENLSSRDLSPDSIARHFEISPRKLYGLFERMGASLRETITTLRLEAAHRDLELGTRKVATILLDYGFGNASTFYRLYKKHFGRPPRSGRGTAASGQRAQP
ncbi:helix-turn-helix transcriptional regulator [Mycobacterium sp. KBS0706]|uniref:helix-turn-helix transcriptional regulator n=1 Tax=Mycobacterium sp. KBS0706 TaxID=2578109 RepID=UPI00110F97E0|nr:helix-turn-helix transcriptional regulator [Mycobacterium sp. KBS0706]TSD88629.1 helix-turn-helix transcriptional regulator [Mycobacterium sp. KBS0706]